MTRARWPSPRLRHHRTITGDGSTARFDVSIAYTVARATDVADEREGAWTWDPRPRKGVNGRNGHVTAK